MSEIENVELERRFELDEKKFYLNLLTDEHIKPNGVQTIYYQNYIYHDSNNQIEERIRKISGLGDFADAEPIYKKTMKLGIGDTRKEFKNKMTEKEFEWLKDYLERELGYKPLIKLHNEFEYFLNGKIYTLELSSFLKPHKQSSIIELEFDTINEMESFEPLDWMGREITNEYSNVDIWKKYNLIGE
jgi:CYTH domain-containing protein